MGHILEKMIKTCKEMNIVSIIDPYETHATHQKIDKESLKNTDVCIDFSNPKGALENIKQCAENKKNLVMATTGWYEKIEEAKDIVLKNDIGFIYGSNFSLGVNVFFEIVKQAARLINKTQEYDTFVHEFHHKKKKDSPSGTALTIGKILLGSIERKKILVTETLNREIKEEELHITSTRGGDIPGTHSVYFDSPFDTIELKHTARGRNGFALGALECAKWLHGKKGFFTLDDWIKDSL